MRKIIFLTVAAVMILAASCGQRQPKTEDDAKALAAEVNCSSISSYDGFLIVPGVRVGAFVLNKEYTPVEVEEAYPLYSKETDRLGETEIKRGETIILDFSSMYDKNDRLIENSVKDIIRVHAGDFSTEEGLKVGATLEELLKAYSIYTLLTPNEDLENLEFKNADDMVKYFLENGYSVYEDLAIFYPLDAKGKRTGIGFYLTLKEPLDLKKFKTESKVHLITVEVVEN